jgi:hypothetical protein
LDHQEKTQSTSHFSPPEVAFSASYRPGFSTDPEAGVQKTGQQAQVMPLMQKIQALLKDRKFEEADKVVDSLLSLISSPERK